MEKTIDEALHEAIISFEINYKDLLDASKVDNDVTDLLYNLGATIKHTFDYFAEEIIKLESQK